MEDIHLFPSRLLTPLFNNDSTTKSIFNISFKMDRSSCQSPVHLSSLPPESPEAAQDWLEGFKCFVDLSVIFSSWNLTQDLKIKTPKCQIISQWS